MVVEFGWEDVGGGLVCMVCCLLCVLCTGRVGRDMSDCGVKLCVCVLCVCCPFILINSNTQCNL